MKKHIVLLLLFSSWAYGDSISFKKRGENWMSGNSVVINKTESVLLQSDTAAIASTIRWYQIFPNLDTNYKNANFPWEKDAYQWCGFGNIAYKRVELKAFRAKTTIEISSKMLSATSACMSNYYHSDLGSFWFQFEGTLKSGQSTSSPGLKDNDHRGILPTVFRVSIRDGEGYLGMLTTFFNVPGLFGAVPYQSMNYIGVDCADVLAATHAIQQGTRLGEVNVAHLVNTLTTIVKTKMTNGVPSSPLNWGNPIEKGDLIAVRYRPSSQFAHIGALYRDANSNGFLDGEDLVIHAGPAPLHISALKEGNFDGEVLFLSFDK